MMDSLGFLEDNDEGVNYKLKVKVSRPPSLQLAHCHLERRGNRKVLHERVAFGAETSNSLAAPRLLHLKAFGKAALLPYTRLCSAWTGI